MLVLFLAAIHEVLGVNSNKIGSPITYIQVNRMAWKEKVLNNGTAKNWDGMEKAMEGHQLLTWKPFANALSYEKDDLIFISIEHKWVKALTVDTEFLDNRPASEMPIALQFLGEIDENTDFILVKGAAKGCPQKSFDVPNDDEWRKVSVEQLAVGDIMQLDNGATGFAARGNAMVCECLPVDPNKLITGKSVSGINRPYQTLQLNCGEPKRSLIANINQSLLQRNRPRKSSSEFNFEDDILADDLRKETAETREKLELDGMMPTADYLEEEVGGNVELPKVKKSSVVEGFDDEIRLRTDMEEFRVKPLETLEAKEAKEMDVVSKKSEIEGFADYLDTTTVLKGDDLDWEGAIRLLARRLEELVTNGTCSAKEMETFSKLSLDMLRFNKSAPKKNPDTIF